MDPGYGAFVVGAGGLGGEDAVEIGGGEGGGAEYFVEVFALLGAWVCEGAEGGDAEEGWGGAGGFGGCGEDCCGDAAGEVEGLGVKFKRGGEERDVQIHVGYFGWGVRGCWGETELGELKGGGEDDAVVDGEVDTGGVGRRECVDGVGAVRLAVDVRNTGVKQDLRPGSFEHAIKDLPIASLY